MSADANPLKLVAQDIDKALDVLLTVDPATLSHDDLSCYCEVVIALWAARRDARGPGFDKVDELLMKARRVSLSRRAGG